ncbi:hypothetical protein DMC47_11765 [Nostoc sp. 3335mG]|nr:hypothetical protein DMC47_11765 [Nostoc sp. 3335mG]
MLTSSAPGNQPYELFSFARRHNLPIDTARSIIDRFGADREGADMAAKRHLFPAFPQTRCHHKQG